MKLIPRWILTFATALIFCSPFFAQGGGQQAASSIASPTAAPDAAWWANDNQADGISTPRYGGVQRTSRYVTLRDGVRLAVDLNGLRHICADKNGLPARDINFMGCLLTTFDPARSNDDLRSGSGKSAQ